MGGGFDGVISFGLVIRNINVLFLFVWFVGCVFLELYAFRRCLDMIIIFSVLFNVCC